MATYAICDVCGHRDDSNYGDGPVLVAGAVVQLRSEDDGSIDQAIDLCFKCRKVLQTKWPELDAAIKKIEGAVE